LINSVQRAFIVGNKSYISKQDLGLDSLSSSELIEDFNLNVQDKSLKNAIDTFKREYITKILEENGWNQTKTAKVLGIQRTYVVRLINELNIRVNKV
jgi:Nif-specific regulatory protein